MRKGLHLLYDVVRKVTVAKAGTLSVSIEDAMTVERSDAIATTACIDTKG